MRAATSPSSNFRSNHNQTDCLADSLTDSRAIQLNPKQDNLCEELARTPQSPPGHCLAAESFTRRAPEKLGFALRIRHSDALELGDQIGLQPLVQPLVVARQPAQLGKEQRLA